MTFGYLNDIDASTLEGFSLVFEDTTKLEDIKLFSNEYVGPTDLGVATLVMMLIEHANEVETMRMLHEANGEAFSQRLDQYIDLARLYCQRRALPLTLGTSSQEAHEQARIAAACGKHLQRKTAKKNILFDMRHRRLFVTGSR
jgi:hypothetical protein